MYDDNSIENDIALLYLSNEVQISENVKLAELPPISSEIYPGTYMNGYIAGWGTTSLGGKTPNELNYARITIYSNRNCNKVRKLKSGQICAGQFYFFVNF